MSKEDNAFAIRQVRQWLIEADIARMMQVCQAWHDSLVGTTLRLDKIFPPCTYRQIKRILRKNRSWVVNGVRLLDVLPGNKMFKYLAPHHITHLQLSCLRLQETPVPMDLGLGRMIHLQVLILDDIPHLTSLDDLKDCSKTLRELTIRRCHKLFDISMLEYLTELRKLYIEGCNRIANFTMISMCENLRVLVLENLNHQEDFGSAISNCVQLEQLRIARCEEVKDLAAIETLRLREVHLEHLPNLRASPYQNSLEPPLELTRLAVSSCPLLYDLPASLQMSIVHLDFSNTHIYDIESIRSCKSLKTLDVAMCIKLNCITPIEEFRNLEALSIWGCTGLRDISIVAYCTSLQWLDVTNVKCPMSPTLYVRKVICERKHNGIFSHRAQIPRKA